MRVEIFFSDDLESIERVSDEGLALGFAHVAIGEREIQIFRDGEIIEQVVLLEDESDILLVELDAAAIVEFVDGMAEEVILTFPGAVEHADDGHQGRFAGARRAHYGDEFAFANFGVDAAQDPGSAGADFVKLFDVG